MWVRLDWGRPGSDEGEPGSAGRGQAWLEVSQARLGEDRLGWRRAKLSRERPGWAEVKPGSAGGGPSPAQLEGSQARFGETRLEAGMVPLEGGPDFLADSLARIWAANPLQENKDGDFRQTNH
ncbi:hypothetical protein NDU88_007089 [Pleurodeles waltl]|uniref:Uncharacterized protein n=1 Tax=Pleurodeles waltl TaxID=8319 RepID=A0AAV7LYU3_PLEWA|nr:hypothetical protein NDU88_007089 [Pleurodeles waltl]